MYRNITINCKNYNNYLKKCCESEIVLCKAKGGQSGVGIV